MASARRMCLAATVLLLTAPLVFAQTGQRPGVTGEFGKVYTLGKEPPIYFILKSAEFSAVRMHIGENDYAPGREQKLLVIHFSVQNPGKEERTVNWATLRFTAVDAENENHENIEEVGIEGKGVSADIALKPAQKVDLYTACFVPAKGQVPKLIVLPPEDDAPVVRYDLRGKVKPLVAPFVDPEDKTGSSALTEVKGEVGAWLPTGRYDVRFDNAEYSTAPIAEQELPEDSRYLLVYVTLKNGCAIEQGVGWSVLAVSVALEDGGEAAWSEQLYLAKSWRPVDVTLKPGQELAVKYAFVLPSDVSAQTLRLREEDLPNTSDPIGREVVYDLSGVG
ncbi:MAG: hypothetical protein ACE149_05685 [Armatimonadota bacterium]